MVEWYQQYLDGIDLNEVSSILQLGGFPDTDTQNWVFEQAALCRLSFATLPSSVYDAEKRFNFPVISKTQSGMAKGRPRTARWAYWLGYIVKKDLLSNGKQLTSGYLSQLIALLLCSKVPPQSVEVRTIFGKLKKEAEACAMRTASIILKDTLKPEETDKQFIKHLKADFEWDLSPDTQMWPMVENGRVRDEWLNSVANLRRSILKKIKKHGLLIGQEPQIKAQGYTRLIQGLPVGSVAATTSVLADNIHLEKGKDIRTPKPLLEQDISSLGEVSITQTRSAEMIQVALRFPTQAMNIDEPFVAVLIATPRWLQEWKIANS